MRARRAAICNSREVDGALPHRFEEVLALLGETRDVVEGRPRHDSVPAWARRRGWDGFLGGLTESQLWEAEKDPASWLGTCVEAPASLRSVATRACDIVARYEAPPPKGPASTPARHIKKRKWAQLQALCSVAAERFGGVERVVDLGSGHGHLVRALALTLRPREALGVERSDAFVARAIELSAADNTRHIHADAADASAGALQRHDLVSGLHPCGALGDSLVRRARDAGAHVLAVSCCYQKGFGEERKALSEQGAARDFVLPRGVLGLANLSLKSFEGSATLQDKRAGRRTRLALRLALQRRGVSLEAGAEGRGLTKERVRHGLGAIAPEAFAERGLSPPSKSELEDAERRATVAHAQLARYALPRHALARVLELAIVMDRARFLAEAGWCAEVSPLFGRRTSPRNLGIVARAPS